jgi:hypothetical protein
MKTIKTIKTKHKWCQTLRRLLCRSVVFWLFVWLALFIFLQTYGAYHFFYLDQQNLFLYNNSCFMDFINKPAVWGEHCEAWMTQHFITPYCGAMVVSVLLILTGMLTAAIIRRIAPQANLFTLSLLPVVTLLFPIFNPNYHYSGIQAFCIMLMFFYGFLTIKHIGCRVVYALITSVILFWMTGAIASLYVVCILLRELLKSFTQAYFFLLPLLLIVGLTVWSVRCSWTADYRFLLLPDGYFSRRLQPGIAVYFSWISLPVILLTACLLHHRNEPGQRRKWVERLIQFAFVIGILVFGMKNYINLKSEFFKELDYYARTEQWDRIIERCRGTLNSYRYKCYLNLALAEKGELGDRMFAFDQSGSKGLVLPKNRVAYVSVILSDICFSMGHIALSQQMAFEANMSTQGAGNPRMCKRLVQTNLIMGAYPVAEKYIAMLEKTLYYSSWAKAQRRFLWNDRLVEADPVLGIKRKCIPAKNTLSEMYGLDFDLQRIALQAPEHRATIQYAGAIYLLDKNMMAFKYFVETLYGTKVLPVLPKSFQEAVIILSEQDPDYRKQFHISEATLKRYADFRQQALANGNNPYAPDIMRRRFGDTYWYYYMFKNID